MQVDWQRFNKADSGTWPEHIQKCWIYLSNGHTRLDQFFVGDESFFGDTPIQLITHWAPMEWPDPPIG